MRPLSAHALTAVAPPLAGVRWLIGKADEASLVRLLRACYGETYSHRGLYQPGVFQSLWSTGALASLGDFDEAGGLRGHTGLWFKDPGGDFVESGLSLAAPAVRQVRRRAGEAAVWPWLLQQLAGSVELVHQHTTTLHRGAQLYALRYMGARLSGLIPAYAVRERLVGGWQTLRATPGCWHGVVLLVLFNLTVVPFMGLIPIYMRLEFGGGTGLTGAVASAQGVGAILGGVLITVLAQRFRRSFLVSRLVWALSSALLVYALAPNRAWAIAGGALLGAASASMFITSSAIIQRDAPPASRGRVMSIMQAAMGVSYGIGLLFIGSIGDATNLRLAFAVGSVLLVVGFAALTARSRHWRAAIDGAEVLPARNAAPDVLSVACGD